MAVYLVIHTPDVDKAAAVRPPSKLAELARASLDGERGARWLRTWSPDLSDDRIVSLWEAEDADAIRLALARYGFLDDMAAAPLRVREWGPEDVLAADEPG
jgi:hypothetical protein